jgi:hypothetical protein
MSRRTAAMDDLSDLGGHGPDNASTRTKLNKIKGRTGRTTPDKLLSATPSDRPDDPDTPPKGCPGVRVWRASPLRGSYLPAEKRAQGTAGTATGFRVRSASVLRGNCAVIAPRSHARRRGRPQCG